MRRLRFTRSLMAGAALLPVLTANHGEAATVASDGGITLWVSYDNSDALDGLDVDDIVAMVSSTSGASCTPTNDARAAEGAPNSPGTCPGGAASCTGREKVIGDIQEFAEYVYQSTDGGNYIRRIYVADEGRSWDTADIRWDMNTAGSSATSGGWKVVGQYVNLRSSARRCIHDVLHHEFGHYFHRLPDRYRSDESNNYYRGRFGAGDIFPVGIEVADPNTVMNSNFPHRFTDTTNAGVTIEYDPPGSSDIDFPPGEVLTPNLLADADSSNDGPNRAHHVHTMPFAQDEWSFMPSEHASLAGAHTEGDFTPPDLSGMPAPDVRFIGDEAPPPGTVLLLDRSGSMGVTTNGIPASQFVQEAGLYLYHSAQPEDFVGTFLYNDMVEELFAYEEYDPANTLPFASFRSASGLTNIAVALKTTIDELIAEHGEGGVNGASIMLMSDGKQTTGGSLWDQVDRANMLGIQIHTFTFGDADITTMEQIATTTSGDITEVSERENAFELKVGMAREFGDIRGYTPVHSLKEPLRKKGIMDGAEVFEERFAVPPKTRDLLFYSFLEGGNAALFDLELVDPAGNVFIGTADSIAQRGRFNGVKVAKPEPGMWTYRIRGSRRTDGVIPETQPFEITAYARNQTLDGSISVGQPLADQPGFVKLFGEVSFRYPLTDLDAHAYIYRGGDALGWVPLYDDGVRGGDEHAGDGVFTGLLDLRRFGLEETLDDDRAGRKTRLDGRFFIGDRARPAPNAHYESGTDYDELIEDFERNGKSPFPFEVWSTRTHDFTRTDRDRSDLRLLGPREQPLLRPGDGGQIYLTLEHAQPAADQLQLSLGQGITAKVEKVEPLRDRLGGTYAVSYEVGRGAQKGPRDLRVQFGSVQFHLPRVLYVDG
jgi:von Willebrand factor type A domain